MAISIAITIACYFIMLRVLRYFGIQH
jgi:hypothetical protein